MAKTDGEELDPVQFSAVVARLDSAVSPMGWAVIVGHRCSVIYTGHGRLVRLTDLDAAESFAAAEMQRLGASGSIVGARRSLHCRIHAEVATDER